MTKRIIEPPCFGAGAPANQVESCLFTLFPGQPVIITVAPPLLLPYHVLPGQSWARRLLETSITTGPPYLRLAAGNSIHIARTNSNQSVLRPDNAPTPVVAARAPCPKTRA